MRLFFLGIFVAGFVVLPMYLLDSLVMPQLQQLANTYRNADQYAQQIAGTNQ